MCGIVGEIRFDKQEASADRIQAMVKRLAPRGPDASGIFLQGSRGFGHRRLKIIDLSEHAQQPMVDNHLGLGIVFNGMIYNYRELRAQLIDKGYRFFSHGDTEVLLKAYHAWGEDFVKRLQGMFAFAIWHRDSGEVIIGRDRLGIKPLYYSAQPNALYFASTLPALLATGNIDTDIDPQALQYYMTFHSVVPAPNTLLKGIRKVPPATIIRIKTNGDCSMRRYWNLNLEPLEEDQNKDFEDWQAILTEALNKAVKRRQIADVPVGVLLSGGVDSSLIVGLLAQHGQSSLNTFSIGFDSVNGEQGDEFKYSDIIAQHFHTEHHKIHVDPDTTLNELPNCIASMAEPMVSHDNIGFYLLARQVSQHVKVVQSGQGADEVFGGYYWYPPLVQSSNAVKDYAHVFFDQNFADYRDMVHPRFVEDDYATEFITNHFQQPGAKTPVDKALRVDTTVMLVDDPVKRVDNMTMAWGLEARVPFLDHELVELAGRVPAEYKVANGGKYILKSIARKLIPAEVIDRPKGYFPVPALKSLQGNFLKFVRESLDSQKARERGLFRPEYLNQLYQAPEKHITPLRGSKLWQVALLESWLQTHGI
jgi:asparagine synthase (glutamine-hydrolysing)